MLQTGQVNYTKGVPVHTMISQQLLLKKQSLLSSSFPYSEVNWIGLGESALGLETNDPG